MRVNRDGTDDIGEKLPVETAKNLSLNKTILGNVSDGTDIDFRFGFRFLRILDILKCFFLFRHFAFLS